MTKGEKQAIIDKYAEESTYLRIFASVEGQENLNQRAILCGIRKTAYILGYEIVQCDGFWCLRVADGTHKVVAKAKV